MQPICERFVLTPAVPAVVVMVEQVYGKPLACLKPPKGYEFTDFRIPTDAEMCMSVSSNHMVYGRDVWGLSKVRLILKKKEPRKVIKHVYAETGEIRRAYDGELYFIDGEVLKRYQSSTGGCYPILKYERIEEMVED